MISDSHLRQWAWLCGCLLLSAGLTWAALLYSRRANLVDQPGQRRSHSMPTPRGGGIGIVLAVIAALFALGYFLPGASVPWRLIAAIVLIAAAGWIDDHRSLSALWRLCAQIIAITIWLWPLLADSWQAPAADSNATPAVIPTLEVVALLGFVCLWSVNLHNFMDGIDGILSMQAIFVLVVMGSLCMRDSHTSHGLQVLVWAAAVTGFLPFNFPRARIFMGDVGSGSLGFLIAVAAIWQFSTLDTPASAGLLAASAFVIDASCTLVSRLVRGRRVYRAHREHLYQWMVRARMSHARVVVWYLAWNLVVVLPVIYWLDRKPGNEMSASEVGAVLWLYIAGIVVWILGKSWCLGRVKEKRLHAAAA